MVNVKKIKMYLLLLMYGLFSGCTVKAVGDPNRPITIQAHITVDIKGLEKTASSIEDYVSGDKSELKAKEGGTK